MHDKIVALVRSRIQSLLPQITEFRHRLHADPEIGLDTRRTGEKIREALKNTAIAFRPPLLGHDVVGDLGDGPHRVLLRADMDALPIQELADHPYKSTNPGRMHACGHDGHMAMLVGAALVLDSLREHLNIGVRFAFQPGEEVICAGKTFVERGVCDGCDAAYAIHGWPGLPVGCITSRPGPLFAAGAHFTIELTGRGCHGALPERGNNPIPPAARVISELAKMHAEVNARDGSVVSVCSFQAGDSSNVIPDTATILGTFRYLDPTVGSDLQARISKTVGDVAKEAGLTSNIDLDSAYSLPVINTVNGYELVKSNAQRYAEFAEAERCHMTMDDFAFYLKGREGAYFLLGLGEASPALHSPTFDFNDGALETGVLMHCLIALSEDQR
jgi:amidohydrolase